MPEYRVKPADYNDTTHSIADGVSVDDMRTIGDIVIIEPIVMDKIGRFYIPQQARLRPQLGIVRKAGPGIVKNGIRFPMTVKPGDKVWYADWVGVECEWAGKKYFVMHEKDIEAIEED